MLILFLMLGGSRRRRGEKEDYSTVRLLPRFNIPVSDFDREGTKNERLCFLFHLDVHESVFVHSLSAFPPGFRS